MASTNTDTDTGNNESTTAATTTASTPPLSVCVIGGGPGAMSFCHSLETQKNDLIKKGVDISQYTFPTIVNCFERSSGPGGVWRSDRTHGDNTNNTNKTNSTNANGNGNGNASADVDNNEEKKEDDYENIKKQKQKTVETLTTTTLNTNTNKTSTNMYSALWTNGVKENFEFPDYTFVDHFGYDIACKLPTYLPRKIVLDYLLARCTNKCPNFFTKYFSFDTTVVNVKYLDDENENENENEKEYINKFQVTIRNEQTGIISIEYYDKCIWAGGNQGIPYIPEKTKQLFEKHNENMISNNNNTNNMNNTMRIVHSSDTANFKSDVENKNILIIGGGLSAEDLALMAIKEGVKHIYITYRSDSERAVGLITSRWPYDKVTIHLETCVTSVNGNSRNNNNNDGDETNNTNTNNQVTLTKCEYCYTERKHELCGANNGEDYQDDDGTAAEQPIIVLNNIDTVIFCTGYKPNFNMLDESLHPYSKTKLGREYKLSVPKDWKMHNDDDDHHRSINNVDDEDDGDALSESSESSSDDDDDDDDEEEYDIEEDFSHSYHKLSKLLFGKNYKQIENSIVPSKDNVYTKRTWYAKEYDTLYSGIFSIINTNMMYIKVDSLYLGPLVEIDVLSWMIVKVVSKQVSLPKTKQDMIDENLKINLDFMKSPTARYCNDPSYTKAVNKVRYGRGVDANPNGTGREKKHNPDQNQIDKVWKEVHDSEYDYYLLLLGKYMFKYDYPVSFVSIYNNNDNITTETTPATATDQKTSYCFSKYCYSIYKSDEVDCVSRTGIDKLREHEKLQRDDGDGDGDGDNKINGDCGGCDRSNGFWRTFRDHPNTDNLVSYFTGIKSVPLPKRWFDLNEDDKLW